MTRPKPKYQIGDRVGNWSIIQSYFSVKFQSWVYSLENDNGWYQLTRFEAGIDRMMKKYEKPDH